MMKDSAEKRVTDSKSIITAKERRKADGEDSLLNIGAERIAKMNEAVATVDVIAGLHKDCCCSFE